MIFIPKRKICSHCSANYNPTTILKFSDVIHLKKNFLAQYPALNPIK
jgi:hypothetical protein